jgi:hypothetical protein
LKKDTCNIDGICLFNGDVNPNPSLDYLVCDSNNPDEWTQTIGDIILKLAISSSDNLLFYFFAINF